MSSQSFAFSGQLQELGTQDFICHNWVAYSFVGGQNRDFPTYFCVAFPHFTGYHLPASYCINLSLFSNLQIKFWTTTGEGEKKSEIMPLSLQDDPIHAFPALSQSSCLFSCLQLLVPLWAQSRLFWWRKNFSELTQNKYLTHTGKILCSLRKQIHSYIVFAASQVSWARNEKGFWQCYQPRISVLSPRFVCRGKAALGSSGSSYG